MDNPPPVRTSVAASAWAVTAAFGTYFCMYGFRKPFTAATFADEEFWGVGFKTILVSAQVLGYTASKFLGIKIVSETTPTRRVGLLLGLVGLAELALLLFAVTPAPVNAIWLFVNGVPLGMVFGLVLSVLEGRRHTEALAAGLCASFVVGDGVTKSVGAYLLVAGVPEFWMPAAAGFAFTPPFLGFTWMLSRVPRPSPDDVAVRSERSPMSAADRRGFFLKYAAGLIPLLVAYLLITILRSVRADFAPEIWASLGVTARPALYSWSEIAVAACVLVLSGASVFIRDNRRAFSFALAVAVAGSGLIAVTLIGLQIRLIGPFAFMVLLGVGLYMPYIAIHTTVFERLIAMTRDRGTIGYLMTLADAVGYLGYVGVLVARTAGGPDGDFLLFFLPVAWVIAAGTAATLIPSWWYFLTRPATRRANP